MHRAWVLHAGGRVKTMGRNPSLSSLSVIFAYVSSAYTFLFLRIIEVYCSSSMARHTAEGLGRPEQTAGGVVQATSRGADQEGNDTLIFTE